MYILHCCQVLKKSEERNECKVKTGFFGLSASTTPLPRSLAWKIIFKSVMMKVIPNMIGTKTPTSKKALMMVMGKLISLMCKLLILIGMMQRKALCPRVTRRTLHLNYFICQHFQKIQVYIIFPLKKPSYFVRKRSKM